MPAISSTAPGKLILFGEHAVVYGRPAIAIPFTGVHVKVIIVAMPLAPSGLVRVEAPAIKMDTTLAELATDNPLALTAQGVMDKIGIDHLPAMHIRISGTIPIAAGMGSSAAVSIALARALSTFLGHPLANAEVNAIAYQVEEAIHGTPSGVDNTVIAYAKPVYFRRGQPLEFLRVNRPFELIIADSGIASATRPMVAGVKERYLADPDACTQIFDRIASIVEKARISIEAGLPDDLGALMIENHQLLKEMGVSIPELDTLVEAALKAGAAGAKLTGAGGGGNIIAIAPREKFPLIENALLAVGARQVWSTRVQPEPELAT